MSGLFPSLDPLLRPRRPAAASAFLCFLLLLLAGCAAEPSPPQAGGPIPVQVYNNTNDTRVVHVEVREPAGASILLTSEERVAPKRSAKIDLGMLSHGDYVLVAKAGLVTREARVDYDAASSFFRFIVEDDVIAFQSG